MIEHSGGTPPSHSAHDTFRHLVENSPFGVYAVDADFRLVQVSVGAQNVFRNVRPLLGRDFAEVLRIVWEEPFATEAINKFRHTLATGEPYHAPATIERRHDEGIIEAYDWKIERVVLPDGRPGVVCHFYDLSERQRYEAALRDADRRKSEFLALLSHELRNPLAPIRAGIYVLERAAPDSEQAVRAREIIRRQADHLTRLVDDLLDITRVSSGKIELKRERVDLRDIVRRTTEDLRSLFDERKIQMRVEQGIAPVWVDADATRLSQVIGNLLQNSLKFTPPGGLVSLRIKTEGERAELCVADNGLGIDPADLERMFEPFAQADQALARTHGGLGLGLSLVRALVELHGGAVRARSEGVGKGAEFTVSLPLAAAPQAAARTRAQAAGGPGRVVLLIEDNEDAALILADTLALEGHQVHVAPTARAGIARAQEIFPEVVLCDIGLPDMDGFSVARHLRGDPRFKSVRLIALSGYAQVEDRQRSLAAGFDAHVAKPPDPDELLRIVSGR